MKQTVFEQAHSKIWHELHDLVQALEQGERPDQHQLKAFQGLFRKVCYFHALAKDRQYSSYLVDELGDIVVRAHHQLYRRKHSVGHALLRFIMLDFPALVRAERAFVLFAAALFAVPGLVLLLGSVVVPELVFTVIEPQQAHQMEAMYDPRHRVVGSARDANTNWGMFGFYIQNNISVAFRTFASGLVLGVGSAFFLVYNGALIGTVAAHLINVGFATTFFTFVIGHGSFELTAIVLSGAAGLKLGYALLVPGQLTRVEALKRAAAVAIRLVYGVIIMLLIAAFIEAFWSSNNVFPALVKYAVGVALWCIVLAYLLLCGRPGHTGEARR